MTVSGSVALVGPVRRMTFQSKSENYPHIRQRRAFGPYGRTHRRPNRPAREGFLLTVELTTRFRCSIACKRQAREVQNPFLQVDATSRDKGLGLGQKKQFWPLFFIDIGQKARWRYCVIDMAGMPHLHPFDIHRYEMTQCNKLPVIAMGPREKHHGLSADIGLLLKFT